MNSNNLDDSEKLSKEKGGRKGGWEEEGLVTHIWNLGTLEADCCETEASLGCRASSGPIRSTE